MAKLRLKDHEDPKPLTDEAYMARLVELQRRMERLQAAYIVQNRRGMVAIEGWDAAGKGGVIQRMVGTLDHRFVRVWSIGAPTDVERRQHYLERFWRRLPECREIAVFDRTWYGRVLVERVDKLCPKDAWKRAYKEINQFEATQAADGVKIVKLFLHTTQAEQDRRLLERLETPWKRWKTGLDDYHNRGRRKAYLRAYEDMFDRCSTDVAPWTVIAADDKKAARIAAMEAVLAGLGDGVDMAWPAVSPGLQAVAEAALGVSIEASSEAD